MTWKGAKGSMNIECFLIAYSGYKRNGEIEMLKILIACGGGFSSSHLVRLMQDEIAEMPDKENYEVDFFQNVTFRGQSLQEYVVIMCCPHLRFTLEKMMDEYGLHNVPLYVIPPRMYGLISASEMLMDAADIVARFKEHPINPFHFPGEENPLTYMRTVAYARAQKAKHKNAI